MGKGKGKKGHKEEKAKIKSAKRATGASTTPSTPLNAGRIYKGDSNHTISKTKLDPKTSPASKERSKAFTTQAARWQSLFKKHLGLIESHIRMLERVMQSMKSEMAQLGEEERAQWESGERGSWRVICGMMDRAREVLANATEASKVILPDTQFNDKKGSGVEGTNFESLGPNVAEQTRGFGLGDRKRDDAVDNDSDGDTSMSDPFKDSGSNSSSNDDSDSDSNSDSDANTTAKGFVPLPVDGKKREADTTKPGSDKEAMEATEKENVVMEAKSQFVIDTEPTPNNVHRTSRSTKKAQKGKRSSKIDRKAKAADIAKETVEAALPVREPPKVDFTAMQAQLRAEVEAGLKRQAEAALEEESKKLNRGKKKRKRDSIGGEGIVETKKVKSDEDVEEAKNGVKKVEREKKRKAVEVEEVSETVAIPVEEGKVKKKKRHD